MTIGANHVIDIFEMINRKPAWLPRQFRATNSGAHRKTALTTAITLHFARRAFNWCGMFGLCVFVSSQKLQLRWQPPTNCRPGNMSYYDCANYSIVRMQRTKLCGSAQKTRGMSKRERETATRCEWWWSSSFSGLLCETRHASRIGKRNALYSRCQN